MVRHTRRPAVALAALAAIGVGLPAAQAQRPLRANPPAGVSPYFQGAPGLNLQQGAYKTATMGRAYQSFPGYALGVAPPYAMGYSPYGNPGVGYPGSAAALANPYAAMS